MFQTSGERTTALSHSLDIRDAPESYAQALLSNYGNDEGLDTMMVCLFTTLEDIFKHGSEYNSARSNARYNKALSSLRQSIVKHLEQKSDTSSVVGAIMLAALYESLTGGGATGVHTHHSALAAIFKSKKPQNVTKFETQVLLAIYGGFVNSATIENRPCFLDDPIWQDYLSNAKRATPGTVHPFESSTRALLRAFSRTPGLLTACSSPDVAEGRCPRTESVSALSSEVRGLLTGLLEWESECSMTPYKADTEDVIWSIFSGDRQRQGAWLNYSMAIALLSRIVIYLDGFDPDLEADAQRRARLVIAMHEGTTQNNTTANSRTLTVFMRYGLALVHTHALFMRRDLDLADDANDRGLIEAGSWFYFHDMLRGRVMPSLEMLNN